MEPIRFSPADYSSSKAQIVKDKLGDYVYWDDWKDENDKRIKAEETVKRLQAEREEMDFELKMIDREYIRFPDKKMTQGAQLLKYMRLWNLEQKENKKLKQEKENLESQISELKFQEKKFVQPTIRRLYNLETKIKKANNEYTWLSMNTRLVAIIEQQEKVKTYESWLRLGKILKIDR